MTSKRKLYREDEKLFFLHSYYQSGMSKHAFCRAHGICCPALLMREASTVEADDSAYLYVSEKRKCLYAVMESLEYKGVPGGGVAAYRIEDNKLSFLNSRYAYGGWPCHVIADEEKDSLLVSVFRNGLLVVYGINQDGSIGEERRVEHHQEPNGRMSHIHASMPTPD